MYRLPGIDFPEFDNISATAVQARDVAGNKVAIIFFNSDALFAINSADLGGEATTASLNAAILAIQNHYPDATVQVRGHTDAQGAATTNQSLSAQRAAAVKGYLNAHGLDPARVSNVGFGSTEPVVSETNPDGSDSSAGRAFNRRGEIVVRAADAHAASTRSLRSSNRYSSGEGGFGHRRPPGALARPRGALLVTLPTTEGAA